LQVIEYTSKPLLNNNKVIQLKPERLFYYDNSLKSTHLVNAVKMIAVNDFTVF